LKLNNIINSFRGIYKLNHFGLPVISIGEPRSIPQNNCGPIILSSCHPNFWGIYQGSPYCARSFLSWRLSL